MTAAGTILVNVFTSDARLPLEGASVLFRQENPPGVLLGFRLTDSSGQTSPLSIPTVDQSLSQAPENRRPPWTGITIQVEHPDYETMIIHGVQIFPGVTTVQNIPLLPLSEHEPYHASGTNITITPQALWEDPV